MKRKEMIFINFFNKRMALYLILIGILITTGVSYAKMHYRVRDLEEALIEEGKINSSLSRVVNELEEDVGNLSKERENLSAEIDKLEEDIENKEKENSDLLEKKEQLQEENEKLKEAVNKKAKAKAVENSKEQTPSTSTSNSEWKSMTVNASAYTLVEHGDVMGGTGLTSTGKTPTANRTIAVDPNVIPYGSLIKYNGVTYTAEDTGGMIKGNKVDIYMNTLEEAVNFGRKDINILVKIP